MKAASQPLLREYQALIRAHMANPGESTLERAYNVGRKALLQELGVVDVAALYHRALAAELGGKPRQRASADTFKALESLFVESLAPYEMTHRGYREAQVTLRRLNELLEDESKKIAHALHDELGQRLVAVRLALGALARGLPSAAQGHLKNLTSALDEMETQLKRLARELRPPALDDLGLFAALQVLTKGFSKRTGVKVTLRGPMDDRLPARVETALYRIVQEALTNVSKHARASQVIIHLQRASKTRLVCSIRDDGIGFNVPRVTWAGTKRGFGLPGMQERLKAIDAMLEITSSPRRGTELFIQVPIQN